MSTERTKTLAFAIADAIGSRPSIHVFTADHFPDLKVNVLYAEGWPSLSNR